MPVLHHRNDIALVELAVNTVPAVIKYHVTPSFSIFQKKSDGEEYDNLIECVKNLNKEIAADDSLGEGFCIGHSYFCFGENEAINNEWLKSVVEYDVIPLLKEYWFDEPSKVREWSDRLRSAIK